MKKIVISRNPFWNAYQRILNACTSSLLLINIKFLAKNLRISKSMSNFALSHQPGC